MLLCVARCARACACERDSLTRFYITHSLTHPPTTPLSAQVAANLDPATTKSTRAVIESRNYTCTPPNLTRLIHNYNEQIYGSNEFNFEVLPSLLSELKAMHGEKFSYFLERTGNDDIFSACGFVMPHATALLEHGLQLYAADGAHYKFSLKQLNGTWLFIVQ